MGGLGGTGQLCALLSVCQTTFNWLHGVVSRICRPNCPSLKLDYSLHTRRQQQQQQNCAIRSSTSRNIAHITCYPLHVTDRLRSANKLPRINRLKKNSFICYFLNTVWMMFFNYLSDCVIALPYSNRLTDVTDWVTVAQCDLAMLIGTESPLKPMTHWPVSVE